MDYLCNEMILFFILILRGNNTVCEDSNPPHGTKGLRKQRMIVAQYLERGSTPRVPHSHGGVILSIIISEGSLKYTENSKNKCLTKKWLRKGAVGGANPL